MERNENVEKLLETVTKLGFSDDVKSQIRESMNGGLAQFSAYEQMRMGADIVDYQLNFSPSKNATNTNVYLNGIDVLLEKDIPVPHKTVLGLDTREVETLLMNKPDPEVMNVGNMDDFNRLMFVHNAKAEEKMKFLSEHAPEVFNALYVKFKPDVDVVISPEMAKQQEDLQKGLIKMNSFSTYYNLTKLELYNGLDGGAIFKTLFKVNKEEQSANKQTEPQQDNKYKAWIRLDFDKKRPDGSYEMQMFHENRKFDLREVLSLYNFKETSNRFDRAEVIKFLQKGSKFTLTNLGDSGEKQVIVRANPEFKNLDLFKLSGEAIKNNNFYRKNPMSVEVGASVSLKKANGVNNSPEQKSMSPDTKNELASRFNQVKSELKNDQKKTPSEVIERRTRNTARNVSHTDTSQGISR